MYVSTTTYCSPAAPPPAYPPNNQRGAEQQPPQQGAGGYYPQQQQQQQPGFYQPRYPPPAYPPNNQQEGAAQQQPPPGYYQPYYPPAAPPPAYPPNNQQVGGAAIGIPVDMGHNQQQPPHPQEPYEQPAVVHRPSLDPEDRKELWFGFVCGLLFGILGLICYYWASTRYYLYGFLGGFGVFCVAGGIGLSASISDAASLVAGLLIIAGGIFLFYTFWRKKEAY
eukprot:PhM_4_TR13337/c0_g1_i1/m.17439